MATSKHKTKRKSARPSTKNGKTSVNKASKKPTTKKKAAVKAKSTKTASNKKAVAKKSKSAANKTKTASTKKSSSKVPKLKPGSNRKRVAAKVAPKRTAVKAKPQNVSSHKPGKKKVSWHNFFTPLDDRLLVEVNLPPAQTPGGIIVPESARKKPNHGRVVSVGRGHVDLKGRHQPMDVAVGDEVVFVEYMGQPIHLNGTDVLILREGDILGVLKP